ncbi:MAG: hypothetical protein HFE42_05245 [Clostridia bacterium]|nr:hypothetical protein [Clostridia bacterium]
MNKRKIFSLTSIGYKILSIILSLFMTAISVVLVVYIKDMPWYALLFSISVLIFLIFAVFLCFNHKVVIDENKRLLKLCNVKTTVISLKEITNIEISTDKSLDDKKYCYVLIYTKDGRYFKTSEYSTLIKSKAVEITKNIVSEINTYLKELGYLEN